MGQGHLLAAAQLIVVACLCGFAAAQGVATRESWGYLHLEARRAEVRRELAGRDDADHAVVARVLAKPDDGVPFARVADALAYLRGVDADAAFVLRATMGAFVLPEVVDPDGANEACRALHVSPFLPFALPFPAPVTFAVEARDASGALRWTGVIALHTEERDVRMARPTIDVPCEELADGAYELTVRTLLGDQPPRPTDPVVRWTFHVLRGYQQRAEAALAAAAARAGGDGLDAAIVLGAAERVRAAYTGGAFAVQSDAARDLAALERALANVAAGKPTTDGLVGDVSLALPLAGGALPCVLRRSAGEGRRPLVVVAAGAPAYDPKVNRPAVPAVRDPRWTADELRDLGVADGWHVAFLASPGGGRDYAAALAAALPWLAAATDAAPGKVALVAEREAAAVAGLALARLRPHLGAAALFGVGALMAPAMVAGDGMPLAYAPVDGLDAAVLQRTIDFAAARRAKGEPAPVAEWLPSAPMPWPFGLAVARAPLAAFLGRAFAGK